MKSHYIKGSFIIHNKLQSDKSRNLMKGENYTTKHHFYLIHYKITYQIFSFLRPFDAN